MSQKKPSKPPKDQLFKEVYFPTQIYFKDLSGAKQLNNKLKKAIYAWQRKDKDGIVRSNVKVTGSWHSATDMNLRPEYAAFVQRMTDTLRQIHENLHYDPEWEPFCDNMWAIINPRRAFNRYHTHPNTLWSGVYYVQAPADSGRVYFLDPRAQAGMYAAHMGQDAANQRETWREVYYEPVEGRVIVFPAWLGHEVEPNMTKVRGRAGDRVCISFNFSQRKKPATPS